MARKRNISPSYIPHTSGRGRLQWYDAAGVRREKLLPGAYGSRESLRAKAALELEITTSALREPVVDRDASSTLTVAEMLLAYLDHAEAYYRRPDGKPGTEIGNVKHALKPVRELYADLPAITFGPKALDAVRRRMVTLGWCRTLINSRVDRIRRAFRWAAAQELVPASVYESLRTLAGLRRGRTEATESEPVEPVEDATVSATLPHLPHHIRVMVELMWVTGMRPSEVCSMTLARIDRGGDIWTYRPETHKTAHHGKERVIPLGPRAQAALTGFLASRVLVSDESLFSPRRAREERFARLRASRKTKVQPSQTDRSSAKPKRLPALVYTPNVISHAVAIAAEKAGVPHWHPYQLRHAFATKTRKAFGLEHAGAALGHTKMSATEVYAERDAALAATVAAEIG